MCQWNVLVPGVEPAPPSHWPFDATVNPAGTVTRTVKRRLVTGLVVRGEPRARADRLTDHVHVAVGQPLPSELAVGTGFGRIRDRAGNAAVRDVRDEPASVRDRRVGGHHQVVALPFVPRVPARRACCVSHADTGHLQAVEVEREPGQPARRGRDDVGAAVDPSVLRRVGEPDVVVGHVVPARRPAGSSRRRGRDRTPRRRRWSSRPTSMPPARRRGGARGRGGASPHPDRRTGVPGGALRLASVA